MKQSKHKERKEIEIRIRLQGRVARVRMKKNNLSENKSLFVGENI